MKKFLVISALAFTQAGATDCGTIIRDSGFDLWCGEQLCTWKVLRGDIARVGTWHEGDSGIEFIGTDAAIHQLTPVNSFDGTCIRFDMIANVEANAEVFLHVDIFGDGVIERSERVPTSAWKPVSFHLFIERPYDGIRFELAKRGTGRAVLAQIAAVIARDCEGIPPIDPGPRPNGASCLTGADCESGLCGDTPLPGSSASQFGTTCMGCDPRAPACGTGEVCGAGEALAPALGVPVVCVAQGSRELAELCISDAECATGHCNSRNQCSSCASAADCNGELCGTAWTVDTDGDQLTPQHLGPDICRPGAGVAAAGAACGTNADCASGSCSGAVYKVCNDGRACGSPADCPVVGDTLAPGPCSTVGIQGGTCD